MSEQAIEIVARGVMVRDGHVLVCHNLKKSNTFLPGGHVEWNESARESLRREIVEEMGRKSRVGRFLGVCEHTYLWKKKQVCEINLVFEFDIPKLRPGKPVPSAEVKLTFEWLPLKKIPGSSMEPRVLARQLARWLRRDDSMERWCSSF
ncbi:MAG TPA: NUDIX domain-containing protein [Kiritimatiellia bacterium]|nr:NUDIX domain-containing protein [Kiritimatiellia bacterium]